MGFLSKLFKSGKNDSGNKPDFSYITEIAGLITENDSGFMKRLNDFLIYTQKECKEKDRDFEYWSGMYDQLEEEGYLFSVDYKCELEDFLWALERLKNYNLIDIDLSGLDLSEDDDVEVWIREINAALNGKACIGVVDMDSDSYELIITTCETYRKISAAAENNEHLIKTF
ncbi:MAG: DUF6630 family protein [Oscillospiraceae bacterium]